MRCAALSAAWLTATLRRGTARLGAACVRLGVTGLALAGLLGVILLGELQMPFEDRFVFFPTRELVATPAAVGLEYEDVRFGPDGRLHGWFVPGTGRTTLLWLHGNAGNISYRVELLRRIRDGLGVSVFIFDYQGYGRSEGRPSERATYQDARAALAYLRSRPDVDERRIVYYGKSLGAAVATELAVEEPPHRLVVQSAFTSILDMARLHYPFLPLGGLLRTRYPTIQRIAQVRAPVLVVHGERDDVVPLAQARQLYEAAGEPKRLLVVEGAGHNDVATVGGQRYLDALRELIADDDRP
jgi:fermentation-respiration switch protein FrsA (DUF1100 family)